MTELAAFKGKYRERYPEAVRSLCEDEEHLLTFYAFPQAMHRHIRSTNAIESFFRNVRRRTDQIDTLYFGNQLSLDCLGRDARDSFVKDCCLVIGLRRKAGGNVCKQPADNGWLGRAFCFSCWPATLVSGSWSLVHLLFFISQSDCSRSYLFHFGVLSRASLFLSTAVSLHNYRDGLFFTCFRSNFKPMRSSSAIPKSPNLTESHRSLRKLLSK